MAIQFYCEHCGKPIEVDEAYIGRQACCPYCQSHNTVPARSTYGGVAEGLVAHEEPLSPDSKTSGHAASEPDAPPPPPGGEGGGEPFEYERSRAPLHVGPAPRTQRSMGRQLGNYALICTVLSVVLFGVMMVIVLVAMGSEFAELGPAPTDAQLVEVQQKVLAQMQRSGVFLASQLGVAFFSLVGVALGIASLRADATNWRGIVSLILCGMFALCFCGGLLVGPLLGGIGG